VDETKGLASHSDYESEYATPPPETRSTDVTSAFSTPANDVFSELEHTPMLAVGNLIDHKLLDGSQSPSVIPSLTNPFTHRLWDQRTVSNNPELSHESLPLHSSSNPLTIEGILNKGGTDPLHQGVAQQDEGPPFIPQIYSDRPVWPLADPAEAKLLRHFVQNLAIWVSDETPLNP
jgi:hypothetical protein